MTLDDAPAGTAPTSRRALRSQSIPTQDAPAQGTGEAAAAPPAAGVLIAPADAPAVAPVSARVAPPVAAPVTPPITAAAAAAVAAPVTATPTESRPVPRVAPVPPSAPVKGPRRARSGDVAHPPALAWLDVSAIGRATAAPGALEAAPAPYVPVDAPDLLAGAKRRSPWRPGVLIPIFLIALLAGAYAATTLLWPLHAIPPVVEAVQVEPIPAPATAPAWPAAGSAAVSVAGIEGTPASASDAVPMASIAKVVTALLVLDEMPLAVGEQGPLYRFGFSDRAEYWNYRANGESALDVPVGGTLSELQLLQGMLIGSANNYADRLAGNLWPTDEVYAVAAREWLAVHGVPGLTIVDPTGFDARNAASPAALITLAEKAMANPVIAGIVGTKAVDLPGAGRVVNTNALLADEGVIGVKTGTLTAWNLLSAKNIVIGETPVRLYASVLGQPDEAARLAASRALYDSLTAELQLKPSVTAGTVAGEVTTAWGQSIDVITAQDAEVVLWNGGAGAVTIAFTLDAQRERGDTVGSLSVTGPLDATTVELRLDEDIEPPTAWWRLTHPLDLLGLSG